MAKIATKKVDGSVVTWTFVDGGIVAIDVTELPREMLVRLAAHGMSQKGGDSYASASDKGLTIGDCSDGVADIIENLRNGVWSATGGSGTSILAEALAELTGESVDAAVTLIASKDDAWKKGLAKRPDIKAVVARIKAERAQAKADGVSDGDADDLTDLFS